MTPDLRRIVFILILFPASASLAFSQPTVNARKPAATYSEQLGGATLQIDFAAGDFDLPRTDFVERIRKAALAVTAYYGRFPVPRARILIQPVAGEDGILQGTTWDGRDGFQGLTRLRIGQHTTKEQLAADWITTHELVHMAFASMPDDQHWLEEGIATYVEPIARVQTGELTAEKVWGDMVAGMPNGEPGTNDRGMNRTHTWGRTYWGGALFCLLADVEIRKQTQNRKGLRDALRAIVAAGGTIDTSWPVDKALQAGDQGTGTHVLEEMYSRWSVVPVTVDLDKLWTQLGINRSKGNLSFDPVAPLSPIRVMLTAPQKTVVF